MRPGETSYYVAVKEGRLRDTPDNKRGYLRTWDNTGKAFGKKKEPKPIQPQPDEFDWLND